MSTRTLHQFMIVSQEIITDAEFNEIIKAPVPGITIERNKNNNNSLFLSAYDVQIIMFYVSVVTFYHKHIVNIY